MVEVLPYEFRYKMNEQSLQLQRIRKIETVFLRVGSHDPFLHPAISLALFQSIEMLIPVTNVTEFE